MKLKEYIDNRIKKALIEVSNTYFLKVQVKIDKSQYNSPEEVVKTQFHFAQGEHILWNYKIEFINGSSNKPYYEWLVKFYTHKNKNEMQQYFNSHTIKGETYKIL